MTPSPFNHLLILLCLLFGGIVSAQEIKYNKYSLELTTGFHVPLSPLNGVSSSEYIAFKQFQVSGRYMISDKFGLKAHYGYNEFDAPNEAKNGVTFHRIGLEGVANLSKLLEVNYISRERFVLLAHGGAGLTFAKPSSQTNTDHIGNFLLGLTGVVKLSRRFSLLADATYLANLRQHYSFDGVNLPNHGYQTGSFLNLSLGISYSFGSKEIHADWY